MMRKSGGFAPAVTVLVLVLGVLVSGLLPLSMPLGLAAGGVLQTGQVEPLRWWLGAAGAAATLAVLARVLRWSARGWWLALLAGGIVVSVSLFVWRASLDQPQRPKAAVRTSPTAVGIVSALPLFWPEGATPSDVIGGGADQPGNPLVDALGARAVDVVDERSLCAIETLILAQPRLLQPEELVALDNWIRRGGRAIVFADPLLQWPSRFSVADSRRAPLTSLLDPLLAHWGLRLEPLAQGEQELRRVMLSDGHVLIVAGASRFTLLPGIDGSTAVCGLAERGLMALCRLGRGSVRLIADADVLDDRLWLADSRWPNRPEVLASDVPVLLRDWIADPLGRAAGPVPRRVADDASLLSALRWAILGAIAWVGLGWLGFRAVYPKWRHGQTEGARIDR